MLDSITHTMNWFLHAVIFYQLQLADKNDHTIAKFEFIIWVRNPEVVCEAGEPNAGVYNWD